jgi:primary-amine oxidase
MLETVDTASNPGPYGNGFKHIETEISQESFLDANPATVRSFAVRSATKVNRLGHPTGYTLSPGNYSPPFSAPDFPPLGRAAFAKHAVWVTRFKESELFAAGEHSFAGQAGAGLPAFISDGERVDGQDLVLWHTLSFTHHPEPEEYPVMNVETLGFKLKPDNFFDWNPALDLPKR